MTDGRLLTEKLLTYATERLELSSYDVPVKRGVLLKMLNLNPGQPPVVKSSGDYEKLKGELIDYVKVKALAPLGEELAFADFLLSLLAPLPSKVDKKFKTMREQFSAQVACDYLYTLSLDVGSVKKQWSENNPVYCQSGEIEVIISDREDINDKAPAVRNCPLCSYTQGFFNDSFIRPGPSCNVRISLGGKDYLMYYIDGTARERECVVASLDHGSSAICEDTVVSMFDFIEYLPEYYVEISDDKTLSGALLTEHQYFTAGEGYGEAVNGKPSFTLRSQLYPDVDVWCYNSTVTAVKLISYNRATLEKCACEVIDGWRSYVDEDLNVLGKDENGENRNFVTLSAGYAKDNRYSLTVVFTADRGGEKADNSPFEKELGVSALFGKVVLKNSWSQVFEALLSALTKKADVDESLWSDGGELFGLEDFSRDILKNCKVSKDLAKTEAALKNAVLDKVRSVISARSIFGAGDKGSRLFKGFLSVLNIK